MQATLKAAEDRKPIVGHPKIVLGITSAQTCLVLAGRPAVLREAGFAVTIVASPDARLDDLGSAEGVATIGVPMGRRPAPLRDVVSFVRLYRLLRRIQPDVVEFSTPKAGLLGLVAAWCARVPRRVYLLRGLKLETAVGFKRFGLLAAEWITSACADAVLCTSASLLKNAVRLKIAPAQKLKMLGEGSSIGVDTKHFSPGLSDVRRSLGIEATVPVVGFVGRLTRDKGIPELLAAFEAILALIPETRLLLVGWFDEAEDALDHATRLRILEHRQIVCTGFASDTAPYYRAMDMMVLPTLREGFPNVVLEASASGIPVITTLSTGSRDAVVPEVTGLLVPAENKLALIEAITRLLRDRELRCRMGQAGRKWVVQHFDRAKVLEQNVKFYKNLLSAAKMPSIRVTGSV